MNRGVWFRGWFAAWRAQGEESCPWQHDNIFCNAMREIFNAGFMAAKHRMELMAGRRKRESWA